MQTATSIIKLYYSDGSLHEGSRIIPLPGACAKGFTGQSPANPLALKNLKGTIIGPGIGDHHIRKVLECYEKVPLQFFKEIDDVYLFDNLKEEFYTTGLARDADLIDRDKEVIGGFVLFVGDENVTTFYINFAEHL